jgi:HAD superfamily hydrolase (TIGR01509 family)
VDKIAAVIFDLDGVLIDSEKVWDDARRQLTDELDGQWRVEATRAMMGMSSVEWSNYMHEALGITLDAGEINRLVVERMEAMYRKELPLIPGAKAAVERMAARWPLGLASSSNRELIDLVLEVADLQGEFKVTVSSEEVARGKPGPDVYLEAARQLGIPPEHCVAVEDSGNGIRSGKAAGMKVIAIPNHDLPPEPEALAMADLVLVSLEELTDQVVERDPVSE